jgi:tripeptidyl-peptidase II
VKSSRKERFSAEIDKYVVTVRQELAKWHSKWNGASKPTAEDMRVRDDLQARLDVLTSKEWDDDPGPLYDCVVFYDGTKYLAAIDTSETGDFTADGTPGPLAQFRLDRQYGTFGIDDRLNFGVNFYQDGTILSIVSDCSPHGTHVAGITGAADTSCPERCGVAPGTFLECP